MSEPLVLHPGDNVAVLTSQASAWEDPLGIGVALPGPVAAGHKIARRSVPVGAALVKFGQFIGAASTRMIVVFTTGRGSAFGSKPAPTIKLATSDRLFAQMPDDMDLNAGDIVSGGVSIADKGREIFDLIRTTASGRISKSEALGLGDNEFVP